MNREQAFEFVNHELDEIKSKIGTAWRNNGIILLKLDEISDEWLRAKLKDYMVNIYGESV